MTNNEFYNKKFLFDTLHLLDGEIQDLETWSAYNDDVVSNEIQRLKKQSDALRKKLISLDLKGQLKGSY